MDFINSNLSKQLVHFTLKNPNNLIESKSSLNKSIINTSSSKKIPKKLNLNVKDDVNFLKSIGNNQNLLSPKYTTRTKFYLKKIVPKENTENLLEKVSDDVLQLSEKIEKEITLTKYRIQSLKQAEIDLYNTSKKLVTEKLYSKSYLQEDFKNGNTIYKVNQCSNSEVALKKFYNPDVELVSNLNLFEKNNKITLDNSFVKKKKTIRQAKSSQKLNSENVGKVLELKSNLNKENISKNNHGSIVKLNQSSDEESEEGCQNNLVLETLTHNPNPDTEKLKNHKKVIFNTSNNNNKLVNLQKNIIHLKDLESKSKKVNFNNNLYSSTQEEISLPSTTIGSSDRKEKSVKFKDSNKSSNMTLYSTNKHLVTSLSSEKNLNKIYDYVPRKEQIKHTQNTIKDENEFNQKLNKFDKLSYADNFQKEKLKEKELRYLVELLSINDSKLNFTVNKLRSLQNQINELMSDIDLIKYEQHVETVKYNAEIDNASNDYTLSTEDLSLKNKNDLNSPLKILDKYTNSNVQVNLFKKLSLNLKDRLVKKVSLKSTSTSNESNIRSSIIKRKSTLNENALKFQVIHKKNTEERNERIKLVQAEIFAFSYLRDSLKLDYDNLNKTIIDYKEQIKNIKDELFQHYHKLLSLGLDTRDQGLYWIINSIWLLNRDVITSYLPKFLDERLIKFIFLYSHKLVELNKIQDLLAEIKNRVKHHNGIKIRRKTVLKSFKKEDVSKND